jgi:hypothetical protein
MEGERMSALRDLLDRGWDISRVYQNHEGGYSA